MSIDAQPDPIVQRAITAAGGTASLAAGLGIKAPSIYNWKRIPSERVLGVEKLTGIPRTELRPDLYPSEAA
jgi:DNA-binding transcriptional regulator YdaS (Cro superfamily)